MSRIFFRIGPKRKIVSAELLDMNQKTFWVRMDNGKIIKRKIARDMVPIPPTESW